MGSSLENSLSSLSDLSISRDRKRLQWGIPVPDDDTQTVSGGSHALPAPVAQW